MSPDPLDAMSAEQAWPWLLENRPFGLRAGRITAYAVSPTVVEIEAGGMSADVGRQGFLDAYRHAHFVPIDTAELR